jgi:hypothetical protein
MKTFSGVCEEAVRLHPNDIDAAWEFVGRAFGHDFLRSLGKASFAPTRKPYAPRTIEPARLERRLELKKAIRSKFSNSVGVAWSDVIWADLYGLQRDGKEAQALLAAASESIPNDGSTVGDILGVRQVDEIIEKLRSAA